MVQRAKVVAVEGHQAVVDIYRSSACGETCGGSCAVCKSARTVRTKAENHAGAKVGEMVELSSDSKQVLGLAFILYILPLIVSMGAYILVENVWLNKELAAIGAFVGLVIGFVPAFLQNRRAKNKELVGLSVTRVLENKEGS